MQGKRNISPAMKVLAIAEKHAMPALSKANRHHAVARFIIAIISARIPFDRDDFTSPELDGYKRDFEWFMKVACQKGSDSAIGSLRKALDRNKFVIGDPTQHVFIGRKFSWIVDGEKRKLRCTSLKGSGEDQYIVAVIDHGDKRAGDPRYIRITQKDTQDAERERRKR